MSQQQSDSGYTYTGAKGAPGTAVAGQQGLWELHPVKGDHGTLLFRFNATTGDCYYLDVRSITNGWQLVPSGMGISDAGVGATAGTTKGNAKADTVTAGSI